MGDYSNGDIIFYAWKLSPKISKIMLPNLRRVYTTNGARMQKYLHGTLFDFLGIDANE